MDDNELGEIGSLSLRDCFRCKGLAVIDPYHMRFLPDLLLEARHLMTTSNPDAERIVVVRNYLKLYADILEGIGINGREN